MPSNPARIPYTFHAVLWRSPGPGGWVFATLPVEMSQEIRALFGSAETGWGRMKVRAQILTPQADAQWETAVWFDRKANSYLLPIQSRIRAATGATEGHPVEITLLL